MIRKLLFNFLLVILGGAVIATETHAQRASRSATLSQPKLVVGIVVDQMRYDYLYRYYGKYEDGGFKRMLREGFNCRNHHYPYGNTSTGAGHASVYSGSIPAIHGIIGNDWFDRDSDQKINCVQDNTVEGVGTTKSLGKASPRNLLVSTMTDQLRIATNFESKVISIALKDRASILPGGNSANAAYWYDGYSGDWITSTYYMQDLPQWITSFNARKLPQKYLQQGWKTLLPIEQYTESTSDNQTYEAPIGGKDTPEFPYDFGTSPGPGLIGTTPWANTLTKDIAIAAIQGERLGKNTVTDFLALSFSAPDMVGHRFGPNSIEQQDVFLRLDRDFAELFAFLDSWCGKRSYTVFLTADHGVMDVPEFSRDHRIPGNRLAMDSVYAKIRRKIADEFGEGDYVRSFGVQLYLDKDLMKRKGVTLEKMNEVIREELLPIDGVADVVMIENLSNATMNDYHRRLYMNQIHMKRSGDILIALQPGWITKADFGTSHGSPYNYDTHVPFVLFGWGVNSGVSLERTEISDIAPTLSALLRILPPSGSIGNPIERALKNHKEK